MAGGILLGQGGFLDQLRSGAVVDRASVLVELFVLAQPEYDLAGEVFSGCLELLEAKKLSPEELAPHLPKIMDIWRSTYAKVRGRQQKARSSRRTTAPSYHHARELSRTLLELFGHFPSNIVLEALHDGVSLSDQRIKLAAAMSLLRLHQPVDARELENIAVGNEGRIRPWRGLKKLGLESSMPKQWAGTAELAASSLADWASSPLEMGVIPEEIELMDVFPTEGEEGILDVYLFRFRQCKGDSSRPSARWVAGIAGPFHRGEELSSPWSAFQAWDAMPPKAHFKKLYLR